MCGFLANGRHGFGYGRFAGLAWDLTSGLDNAAALLPIGTFRHLDAAMRRMCNYSGLGSCHCCLTNGHKLSIGTEIHGSHGLEMFKGQTSKINQTMDPTNRQVLESTPCTRTHLETIAKMTNDTFERRFPTSGQIPSQYLQFRTTTHTGGNRPYVW